MERQYTNNVINEAEKTLSGVITYGSLDRLFDGNQDATSNYMTLKKDPNTTENIVIGFRFPESKLIGRLTLNSRKDYTYLKPDKVTGVPAEYTEPYADQSIRYFNLFGSNNATTLQNGTWKNILSTYARRSNGTKQVFEISNPEEFQFYKIEIVDNYGGQNEDGVKVVSPVEIEMMEMIVPMRYLIKDDMDIKIYNNETSVWSVVGTEPADIEMFNSYGMTSLAGVPWQELSDDTPSILCATYYVDEEYDASYIAVPPNRTIYPTGDISIANIVGINSITFAGQEMNSGMVRILISVDEGVTWKAWDSSNTWRDIDNTNEVEVRSFGLSFEEVSERTRKDWDALTNGKDKIRFAYYFKQDIYTDKAEIDSLIMNVEMKGAWEMAIPGQDYTYSYSSSTDLMVSLTSDGDYKINY